MALQYPSLVEFQTLAAGELVDGTLTDVTEKMIDGNLDKRVIDALALADGSSKGFKITFDTGFPPAANDFVRIRNTGRFPDGGTGSAVHIRMRAYVRVFEVTTTDEIIIIPTVGSEDNWLTLTMTAGFITALNDLGFGKFAVRVEAFQTTSPNRHQKVQISESEGDLTQPGGSNTFTRSVTMAGAGATDLVPVRTSTRSVTMAGAGTMAVNTIAATRVRSVTMAGVGTVNIGLESGTTKIRNVTMGGVGAVALATKHIATRSVTMAGAGTTNFTATKGNITIDLQNEIELTASMTGVDLESDGTNYWIVG